MRISDWSSDVCSSDLDFAGLHARPPDQGAVGRRIDGRKLRRGVVAETVGNSEDVPGIDHRLFGEAAPRQACADPVARIQALDPVRRQIGSASCRERGCQVVYIWGVAGTYKKKKK